MNPNHCCFRIRKNDPLNKQIIPLVLQEVQKEMEGRMDRLEYTDHFLKTVCPDFNECKLLLSLGSGTVPPSSKQTRSQWIKRENKPPPMPRPPSSCMLPQSDVIPADAYASHIGRYIRFQPDVYQISHDARRILRVDDWTIDFERYTRMQKLYSSLGTTGETVKRLVYMLQSK